MRVIFMCMAILVATAFGILVSCGKIGAFQVSSSQVLIEGSLKEGASMSMDEIKRALQADIERIEAIK